MTLPADSVTERAIALLRDLLDELGPDAQGATPYDVSTPGVVGASRLSATEQLTMWFRPAAGRSWEDYFADPVDGHGFAASAPFSAGRRSADEAPALFAATAAAADWGPWARRRLVLAQPEPELIDTDAASVVECLYDFVHAIGRREVERALECVADDFHAMEDDVEVDRHALGARIKMLLDRLIGWDLDVALVEIPRPILHPDAILVYAELRIDARRSETGERKTIRMPRIAVFRQQRDRSWLLAGMCTPSG
jgi:ketosteroid isomerase-like protein